MGLQNIKFETEVFQQIPQFQIPNHTPVETKADPTQLVTISSQIAQLTATVNQLTQVVAGQAFTRQAPQAVSKRRVHPMSCKLGPPRRSGSPASQGKRSGKSLI